jgi:DNA processing protein
MLRLHRIFGSARRAVKAPLGHLVERGGLSQAQAERLHKVSCALDHVRALIAGWERQGIALISIDDAEYPARLRDLVSPPPLLYISGSLAPADTRAVAVVGTRSPDLQGVQVAQRVAEGLAHRGFTNVSGLARGVDTAGHQGALAAEEGRTIAVLGSGLLRVYPPENSNLAGEISARGCLVAEVPPETNVSPPLLLARDRIQAALSRAVIVIQAHGSCGSIVTARHAMRHGRLLYAVPWPDRPFSDGWRRLRAMGARPLEPDTDLDVLAGEIEAVRAGPAARGLL